ncbi:MULTISPECIES: hypothetical protein [unclassified Flavobacterium]|uniref:hypothetical protein n=1 Tax=unclassified Flavobacterium TaxID=196869 RepID=UPI001F13E294|nr:MULTISPECIES: hypothetical protein [unclassified Flavobacterium]UMY66633.1 hypothetical protein MKO97_04405 [Flavobacterium sp. HJ-32-4]
MKFNITFLTILLGCVFSSQAQSIFTNPITGTNPNTANPYTTGQTVASNMTVSGIGRGTGVTGSNANDRYNATGWNSGSLDTNDYFEFTMTPASGYQISLVSLVYTGQTSGTGPTNFALRSSVDSYASNIGTPTATGATISLSGASYQNLTSAITFRLYGWGASAAGGTFSINDFTFNGTVSTVGALDGNIVESDWGTALATSTGGPTPSFGASHAINALYCYGDATYLYFAIAGNVQSGNRIMLFIDSKSGGYNNGSFNRTNAPQGIDDFNSSTTFDSGFNADYCAVIGTNGSGTYFLDLFTLAASGSNTFIGSAGTEFGINVSNTDQTKGFEFRIPKTSLGYTANQELQLFAAYTSDAGFLSNQFLTKAGSTDGSYGNGAVTFGSAAPDPVTVTYSSKQTGNFTTGTTWKLGTGSPSGVTISIESGHNVTVNTSTSQVAGVRVNSGGTLTLDSGGLLNVSRTGGITFNNAGTTTFTSGGLKFFQSVTFTNTGTFTAGTGTVEFVGGSLSGTLSFYNMTISTAGLALSSSTTITNLLTILPSGFVDAGSAPIYGSSSTLVYSGVSGYNRGNEWTGASSGAGCPANVTLSSSSFNMNLGSAFCTGSVTISAGSTLNTAATSLTIGGNLSINSTDALNFGTLNMLGDIYVAGNWTVGAFGVQSNNGKAVFFNGTGTQVVSKTGGGTVFFDYLVLNKSAGTVQFSASPATDVVINSTAGDVLQLVNAGTLDVNGRTLTLNNAGGNILCTGGVRTITSTAANGLVVINGYKSVTGTGTLTIATNVTMQLSAGINFGVSKTTFNGRLQLNGGGFADTSPIYATNATLIYNGNYNVSNEWTGNAATPGLGIPFDVRIQNAAVVNLPAGDRGLSGSLTINNGTLNFNAGGDLYLNGNLSLTTFGFSTNGKRLYLTGTSVQTLTADNDVMLSYLYFQPTSGSVRFECVSPVFLYITAPAGGAAISFNSANDILDFGSAQPSIGTSGVANTIAGSGKLRGYAASTNLTLLGTGSIGTLTFDTGFQNLRSLSINRTSGSTAASLGSNLTIANTMTFTAGHLDLNGFTMTLPASMGSFGSSSSFVIASTAGSELRKLFTAAGSYTFPVGDNVGTTEYSPATVTCSGGSYSGYIGVSVRNTLHPGLTGSTNYINRYWAVTASGVTPGSYSFSGTYLNADIINATTNCKPGRYNGSTFTDISATTVSANTLSLSGLTTFDSVNEFAAGDRLATATYFYRSAAAGAWSTASNWQVSANNLTGWTTAFYPPGRVASAVTIRNTFDITVSSGTVNAVNVWIDPGANLNISGGTFVLEDGSFSTDLTVNGGLNYSGGTFTQGSSIISFAGTGTFSNSASSSTIFIPTATWSSTSTCSITGLTSNAIISSPSALAQSFGNFTWNNANQNNYVNVESNLFSVSGTLTIGPSANTRLSLANSAGTYTNSVGSLVVSGGVFNVVGATATSTLSVTGNITVSGGTLNISQGTGTGSLTGSATSDMTVSGGTCVLSNSSGTGALSVRDLGISSGSVVLINNSASPSTTLTINRNLSITGSGSMNLEAIGSSTGVATVNVTGNFSAASSAASVVDFGDGTVTNNTIAIRGNFTNSSTGTFYTTSVTTAPAGFTFAGTGTQTFSYTGANSEYTPYRILSGATVQMNSNLTLGANASPSSIFSIASGATLNMQTNSIIAAGTTNPQVVFTSGATLITANTAGIGGSTASGSFRSFSGTGTAAAGGRVALPAGVKYVFNGTTTTPFPTTAFGNPADVTINSAVTSNLTAALTVTGPFTVNTGGTFKLNSATGNHLSLNGTNLVVNSGGIFDNNGTNQVQSGGGTPAVQISGTFITRDPDGFVGTGAAIPSITPVLNTGSTVEYALTGNQAVQGTTAPTYQNITFSGGGTKTLASTNAVVGTITISDSVVFDAGNNAFGSTTSNLTMTGTSRYKLGGTTASKPESGGTYSLGSGTTIEFTGTSATNIRVSSPTINYANVEISGTNVSNPATVTGIRFQAGGTFTVKNGGTFKLANTAGFTGGTTTAINNTNNPTVTLEAGSKIEYAGANQTLTPFTPKYQDLAISGTGTKSITSSSEILVGNNLTVSASTLEVPSEKLLTVTNAITNTGGTIWVKDKGNLVQITDGISNTGDIVATRISRSMDHDDYIYWGQPVQGNMLTMFPGQFDAAYMWDLDGSFDGSWSQILSTVPGRGFITRLSEAGAGVVNFDFTGVPNNGVITVAADSYDDGATPEATGNTVLLGNPYPCAISAAQLVSQNSSSLEGTLYFWTAITPMVDGAYSTSDYASWNGTGGVATTDTSGTNDLRPSGNIGAGQGFFALLKSDMGVTFNNSMRLRTTTDNGQFFRTGSDVAEGRLWLNLTNQGGAFRQTLVGYVNEATNGYETKFDGSSFTDNVIDIYSLLDDKKLVIQGRGLPFETSDIVPLGIRITMDGSYQIAIDEAQGVLAGDQGIYLEDLQLHLIHDLKAAPYTFTTDAGTFHDRFRIRYTDASLEVPVTDAPTVSIYSDKKTIVVDSPGVSINSVKVIDLLGRVILDSTAVNATRFQSKLIWASEQALVVTVVCADGTIVKKKLVIAPH